MGIAPKGFVTFISHHYGRHLSKAMTEDGGLIELLEPGDFIVADRAFEIQTLLAPKMVTLNIPPLVRGKGQLTLDGESEMYCICTYSCGESN